MSRHCSSVKSVGYDLSFIAPLPQNLTPTRRVNNSPDQMSRDNNCLNLANLVTDMLLLGFGVMGSGLVVNRPREAESLGIGPDRAVDPLVALVAKRSESHGEPDQVDDPARRGKVL